MYRRRRLMLVADSLKKIALALFYFYTCQDLYVLLLSSTPRRPHWTNHLLITHRFRDQLQ